MKASHLPPWLEAALRQRGLRGAGRLSHLEGLPSLLPRRWVCLFQLSLPPSTASSLHSFPCLFSGISRSTELISSRLPLFSPPFAWVLTFSPTVLTRELSFTTSVIRWHTLRSSKQGIYFWLIDWEPNMWKCASVKLKKTDHLQYQRSSYLQKWNYPLYILFYCDKIE